MVGPPPPCHQVLAVAVKVVKVVNVKVKLEKELLSVEVAYPYLGFANLF